MLPRYKSDILIYFYGLTLVFYKGLLGPIKPMDVLSIVILLLFLKERFHKAVVVLLLVPFSGLFQTIFSSISGVNYGLSSVVRIAFGMVFILAAYAVYRKGKVNVLLRGFISGVLITGILAVLQKFGFIPGDYLLYRNSVAVNIQGFFSDPNRFAFAIFLSALMIRIFPNLIQKRTLVLSLLGLVSLFVGSRTLLLLLPLILFSGVSVRVLVPMLGFGGFLVIRYFDRLKSALYIFSKLSEGGIDYRNDPRFRIFQRALESIQSNIFGSGIDAFALSSNLTSHNSFLELLLISGLFGLISILVAILYGFLKVRSWSTESAIYLFALTAYLATINILFMGFAMTCLTILYLYAARVYSHKF